jgi:hypothetical protein
MAEQDYVSIPTSVSALIAADDPSGVGTGPFLQQISLANLTAELRALVNILGKTFGENNDTTGRIRVLLDSITGALTLATVTTVTTCSTVTNAAKLTGFGSAATDASIVPYDINANAWNQYRNNVVVS